MSVESFVPLGTLVSRSFPAGAIGAAGVSGKRKSWSGVRLGVKPRLRVPPMGERGLQKTAPSGAVFRDEGVGVWLFRPAEPRAITDPLAPDHTQSQQTGGDQRHRGRVGGGGPPPPPPPPPGPRAATCPRLPVVPRTA